MESLFGLPIIICFLLVLPNILSTKAQCVPSGTFTGTSPPPGQCPSENDSDCCVQGELYTTYRCSPQVWPLTPATLRLNSFRKGNDGGGPSECDNQYHPDDDPVVALSTGWFDSRSRCMKFINIYGNGHSVRAMVVDECDSTAGCDGDHGYQPPCSNDVVDASSAVWRALGVPERNWGDLSFLWQKQSLSRRTVSLAYPSGFDTLTGVDPPPGQCPTENDSDCCTQGATYAIFLCSPSVSSQTPATLRINSFEEGKDGGGPSACDNQYVPF
ncbi:hypothetical protein RJ639_030875 [Escallonia herrerae]|uniref:Uncharacterized protein n=1 Tax=Escallonia herrerae TaxID=1293975 RepID=A0AA88X7G0_9ASTE|nr:hypothetical protein RJ639_030875 [Escallonia herrerae]